MAGFDFGLYRDMLRKGDPRMDPASGYYWRYLLAVGWLIEKKGSGPEGIFRGSPPFAEIIREIGFSERP